MLFKAFQLSPDKKLASFGRSGSAPGRFGVVAGIVTDSRGNVLVADKLKSVVMVFDKNFDFLTEFGYRGSRPENLVVPDDLADRRAGSRVCDAGTPARRQRLCACRECVI